MTQDYSRRHLMAASGAVMATLTFPKTVRATLSRNLDAGKTQTRIAFGSCAHQDKDQPVWDAVLRQNPDLFLFLGDNIYGDTRDMNLLRAKYDQLEAKPGFQKLRDQVPILAVWDDHDFGENDAGAEYPFSRQSRDIFLEFWQEPALSPRRGRDGIYASYIFGPDGHRVQIILPDLRTHRSAITKKDLGMLSYEEWAKAKHEAGELVPGPYVPVTDPAASMLGDAQWAWLEEQFRVPAEIRLFGSSLQVLADFPGWEGWAVYPADHQRLIDTIARTQAKGVVFLSGDTHYGEISKLDQGTPYPFWDITSSGLTEVWPVLPPNDRRVSDVVREVNFGLIDIVWDGDDTQLSLEIRDVYGELKVSRNIWLTQLKA